jgi:hypothetical protein
LHHPSELTYYDELGVEKTAATEQVRDAFRALVRIVHPDHQTDPQLKEIAEKQMRKLNRVYAILSDPDKRRRYDESLERTFGPTIVLSPEATLNVRRLAGRIAWVAAAALTVITLVWLSTESPAAHVQFEKPASPAAVATRPDPPRDDREELREELRTTKLERDLAIREVQKLRGIVRAGTGITLPVPTYLSPAPIPATLTELPSPTLPRIPPPSAETGVRIQVPKAVPRHTFAGFWFYSKQSDPFVKASTLYPPEFIEATLSEQNGVVRGKYRSRYKIVDRAISPDVLFEFSGTANGNMLTATWVSPSGARGEIILKMAGDNALKVDWSTSQPGSVVGLISGTATLTRRLD